MSSANSDNNVGHERHQRTCSAGNNNNPPQEHQQSASNSANMADQGSSMSPASSSLSISPNILNAPPQPAGARPPPETINARTQFLRAAQAKSREYFCADLKNEIEATKEETKSFICREIAIQQAISERSQRDFWTRLSTNVVEQIELAYTKMTSKLMAANEEIFKRMLQDAFMLAVEQAALEEHRLWRSQQEQLQRQQTHQHPPQPSPAHRLDQSSQLQTQQGPFPVGAASHQHVRLHLPNSPQQDQQEQSQELTLQQRNENFHQLQQAYFRQMQSQANLVASSTLANDFQANQRMIELLNQPPQQPQHANGRFCQSSESRNNVSQSTSTSLEELLDTHSNIVIQSTSSNNYLQSSQVIAQTGEDISGNTFSSALPSQAQVSTFGGRESSSVLVSSPSSRALSRPADRSQRRRHNRAPSVRRPRGRPPNRQRVEERPQAEAIDNVYEPISPVTSQAAASFAARQSFTFGESSLIQQVCEIDNQQSTQATEEGTSAFGEVETSSAGVNAPINAMTRYERVINEVALGNVGLAAEVTATSGSEGPMKVNLSPAQTSSVQEEGEGEVTQPNDASFILDSSTLSSTIAEAIRNTLADIESMISESGLIAAATIESQSEPVAPQYSDTFLASTSAQRQQISETPESQEVESSLRIEFESPPAPETRAPPAEETAVHNSPRTSSSSATSSNVLNLIENQNMSIKIKEEQEEITIPGTFINTAVPLTRGEREPSETQFGQADQSTWTQSKPVVVKVKIEDN